MITCSDLKSSDWHLYIWSIVCFKTWNYIIILFLKNISRDEKIKEYLNYLKPQLLCDKNMVNNVNMSQFWIKMNETKKFNSFFKKLKNYTYKIAISGSVNMIMTILYYFFYLNQNRLYSINIFLSWNPFLFCFLNWRTIVLFWDRR